MRDYILFDQLDSDIEITAKTLADSCRLAGSNAVKIEVLIQENQAMRLAFQESVLGYPSGNTAGIRGHIMPLWEDMTQSYTPLATASCDTHNATSSGMMESLRNSIQFGGGIERGLEEWRKGLRLLR